MILLTVLFFNQSADCAAISNYKATQPILKTSCYILTGGFIVIRAQLPNYPDTLNFILDTGSGIELLDSLVCKKYSLPIIQSNLLIEGISGKKIAGSVYISTLKIQNLTTDPMHFYIDNLQFLSYNLGMNISGILGKSFFKQFIIEINRDDQVIKFYHHENFVYPKKGIVLPMNVCGFPTINIFAGEREAKEGKFIFDMGAAVDLMVNSAYLKDQELFDSGKKMYLMEAEGIGGKKEMYITTMQTLTLGKYKFKKVPVLVFDDENKYTKYPLTNGIVGNGILRRFNILLNYSANEVHLLPNKNFNESFSYSYTGLSLCVLHNKVFVSGVVKNSPADKAGIMNGDEITTINKQSSLSLNDVQNYIVDSEGLLIFTVTRDSKLIRLKLKPQSILKS